MTLLETLVNAAATVAAPALGYLVYVARRIDKRLEQVDEHERAIHGDESINYPGLVAVTDRLASEQFDDFEPGEETDSDSK